MEFDPTGNYEGEVEREGEIISVFLIDAVKKELDYLANYHELRNNGEIIMWAVKFLEDVSKMDEKGVKMFFVKCPVDEDGKTDVDDTFKPAFVPLIAMRPNKGEFRRVLPDVAQTKIEKKPRKKKNLEGDKSI